MATKPQLCKLEKGKIIDAQKGFVDTFNWMVSVLDELTPINAKISDLTVLVGSEYDASTHKFTVKTRKARAIVLESRDQESTVFEATALTGED